MSWPAPFALARQHGPVGGGAVGLGVKLFSLAPCSFPSALLASVGLAGSFPGPRQFKHRRDAG